MGKNNNGVTMTALVVTLIVMTILLSVTMSVSTELLSDSKIKSYISEMYTVQARVKSIAETLDFEAGAFDDTFGFNYNNLYLPELKSNYEETLLKNLHYIEVNGTDLTVNKIGTRVVTATDKIPGIDKHPKYKEGDPSYSANYNTAWFSWDGKTLADNGFDANMLGGSLYYVNFITYDVVLSKGFTTSGNNRRTVYFLEDMLKTR